MTFLIMGIALITTVLFQNCGSKSYSPAVQTTQDSLEEQEPELVVDSDGNEVPVDHSEMLDYAEKSCNNAFIKRFEATTLAKGTSITKIESLFYKGNQVFAIRDTLGVVILSGDGGTDPVLDQIKNFRGTVILCGMSVSKIIGNTVGLIYVVDGDVGNVSDFSGSIIIKRGSIMGSVSKSKMKYISIDAAGKYSHQSYNQ